MTSQNNNVVTLKDKILLTGFVVALVLLLSWIEYKVLYTFDSWIRIVGIAAAWIVTIGVFLNLYKK